MVVTMRLLHEHIFIPLSFGSSHMAIICVCVCVFFLINNFLLTEELGHTFFFTHLLVYHFVLCFI
jgi:hypothetical protein